MPSGRSASDRVPVRCFGRSWLLRRASASEWMQAALSTDLAGIFPGLVADRDAGEIFGLWMSEPDMQRRCINVSRKALERAANREWHWTLNMIKEIQESWTHVNGKLVREGVRADTENLGNYLDAAYTLFAQILPEKEFKAFETRLRRLPAGGFSGKPRMSSRADLMAFAKD